jgi:hypothetical protein
LPTDSAARLPAEASAQVGSAERYRNIGSPSAGLSQSFSRKSRPEPGFFFLACSAAKMNCRAGRANDCVSLKIFQFSSKNGIIEL